MSNDSISCFLIGAFASRKTGLLAYWECCNKEYEHVQALASISEAPSPPFSLSIFKLNQLFDFTLSNFHSHRDNHTMQFTTSLFLALIGSYVSAAPAPSCSVLDIFFTSLVNDFTLSVLIPSQGRPGTQDSWALLLDPRDPSETVTSVPIISRTRIAQPTFRLVNQTLVTAEGGFPAIGSPGITIFPPPLQGWEHGGPGETPLSFGAVYACDATGQQYIKLVADSGFALSSVAEGQRVFIKPQAFEGQAVDVTLRVDGGQG